MESTSSMHGTLDSTVQPSASRDATISFNAEFFAPPAVTVPRSGSVGLDDDLIHGLKYRRWRTARRASGDP